MESGNAKHDKRVAGRARCYVQRKDGEDKQRLRSSNKHDKGINQAVQAEQEDGKAVQRQQRRHGQGHEEVWGTIAGWV